METKIKLPGKNAYEKQLLKTHRREVKSFLVAQRDYTPGQIAKIINYYDKKVNQKNIKLVYTHSTLVFLTALCTGELSKLYGTTTSKI